MHVAWTNEEVEENVEEMRKWDISIWIRPTQMYHFVCVMLESVIRGISAQLSDEN